MAEDEVIRLRTFLEAAKSPGDVVAACSAVESMCRQFPRSFLRICLPVLLRKVFGFADVQGATAGARLTSGGWLSLVALPGNETAAGALITLLAPGSSLFRLLLTSDSDNVVKYVFPFERLPDWVRRLLVVQRGGLLLEYVSVVFKDRLKEDVTGAWQIELDVFQYYVFWFAYYAVCREPERKTRGNISRSQIRSQFESWAYHIPRLQLATFQHATMVTPLHPYLQLLQLYLSHFVGPAFLRKERLGVSVWQDNTVTHSDILFRSLIDFWLIDDDPCPFSLSICQMLQLHTLDPVPAYSPPGRELTDAVRLMINYFSSILQTQLGNHEQLFLAPESAVAFRRKAALLSNTMSSPPSVPSTTTSPYMQSLQRPLYRFCLRAFCYWTMGTPLQKVLPVVDVWLHYLEPWSAIVLVPKGSSVEPGSRLIVEEMNQSYSAYWQGYVVSNYLFYTSMVSHFLNFALKLLLLDMELIFQTTCKVLTVLSKSSDLLDLLRRVDAAYADHAMGVSLHSGFGDRIVTIHEQLKDWEEGVTTPELEHGEMLRLNLLNRTPRLHLFATGEYGAHHVLQTMILHAEAEIRACCTEKLPMSPKTLETAKTLMRKIFHEDAMESPFSPVRPFPDLGGGTAASEAGTGFQRRSPVTVRYKGDWMRRPIESQEIVFLVRILVQLSDWMNSYFGLTGADRPVESVDNVVESLFPERVKPALKTFRKVWLAGMVQLKRRGFRVNLRCLAHRQRLQLLVLIMLVYWLCMKLFSFVVV